MDKEIKFNENVGIDFLDFYLSNIGLIERAVNYRKVGRIKHLSVEDAKSEATLKMIECYINYKGDPSDFSRYLFSSLVNAVTLYIRNNNRMVRRSNMFHSLESFIIKNNLQDSDAEEVHKLFFSKGKNHKRTINVDYVKDVLIYCQNTATTQFNPELDKRSSEIMFIAGDVFDCSLDLKEFMSTLNSREKDIMRLAAEGFNNLEIANQLQDDYQRVCLIRRELTSCLERFLLEDDMEYFDIEKVRKNISEVFSCTNIENDPITKSFFASLDDIEREIIQYLIRGLEINQIAPIVGFHKDKVSRIFNRSIKRYLGMYQPKIKYSY